MAIAPSIPIAEKEYEIADPDVSVRLQEDGSLIVRESLPFDFTGDFSGAYRDIPLVDGVRDHRTRRSATRSTATTVPAATPRSDRSTTRGRSARRADAGRVPRRLALQRRRRDPDVRPGLPRHRRRPTVYDDVVDVGWNVWGSQWDFWSNDLHASIAAASGAAPEQAWVRPRSLGEDVEVGDDASVSIDRVPEGEAVGLRAVFPRDAIDSHRRRRRRVRGRPRRDRGRGGAARRRLRVPSTG